MPIILCEMLLHFVVALFYLEEESRERERDIRHETKSNGGTHKCAPECKMCFLCVKALKNLS